MDWSLVLASQGMEPVIEVGETGQWSLSLPHDQLPAALTAIDLYRRENRRWPWRGEISSAGVVFDWASVCWVLLIATFYWPNTPNLRSLGIMDSALVAGGEWWRLFTALWLHADLAHLATNAAIGLLLLGLVMGRFGSGLGLLAACVAGAGGNCFALIFDSGSHRSLGASGLVMGCLGLLALQSFPVSRKLRFSHAHRVPRTTRLKRLALPIAGAMMLFVLVGVTPGTDILAHFGGFCSGLVLGLFLGLIPNPSRSNRLNLAAAFVFAALTVIPWWLAFAHSPPS